MSQKFDLHCLQTHHYDGKLREILNNSNLLNELHSVEQDDEKKKEIFITLLNHMQNESIINSSNSSIYALHCLRKIIFDSPDQNYDKSNDLDASNLLYMICQRIFDHEHEIINYDLYRSLVLQLEDMISGLCPEGRTTRLVQVLVLCTNDNNI